MSLHDKGDAASACNFYYRAIQLDGRNKAAYNNLGGLLVWVWGRWGPIVLVEGCGS